MLSRLNLFHHFAATSAVFSLALFALPALRAQTPLGAITGVVADSTGSPMPGVKVTVTDTERGRSYETETNATGFYRIPDLTPSTYRITAEKSGFETFVLGSFPLSAMQIAAVNITLKVGTLAQQAVVTAQTQMVEPSNATLGGLVGSKLISDLPLVSRDILTLLPTIPGVQPSLPNNYQSTFFTTAIRFTLNGGLESTSQILLDGVSALSQSDLPGIYGGSALPTIDAIQEMRVQTNAFSAAYGRSGGGLVTMVTKSGTNSFHGDAYDYLQNDALSANGFFANRSGSHKAPLRYNDYGGTVGGPVIKDRTFFFFSYEGLADHLGQFGLFTVPTAAERSGDFSRDLNAAGQLITIYNPFTTQSNASSPGNYVRTPFPGNSISASLFDPVAVKSTAYYPLPIQPGVGFTSLNNLGIVGHTSTPSRQIDLKIDHNLAQTKRLFLRYDYLTSISSAINYWDNPAASAAGQLTSTSHNGVLGYTQTFGSSTVLDLRAGVNRFVGYRPTFGYGFDVTTLGLPASLQNFALQGTEPTFPSLTIGGYSMLGPIFNSYYDTNNTDYDFVANLSHVIGRHTIQVGAESTSYFLSFFQTPGPFTGNFSVAMTQGPNPLVPSKTGGDGFASFLLGTGDSGYTPFQPKPANANHYFAQYVQDDIKLTPRLTINLGFRFEQETATTERYNRMDAIDPTVLNPISQQVGFNVYGGYVFPGSGPDSLGRRAIRPVELKSNPRVGVAYMLNAKTVVRAGYGIFYGVTNAGATDGFTGGGFSVQTPWLATLDGITPNNRLSNPFPQGYLYPPGSQAGLLSGVGTTLVGPWPQALQTAYNQQWNFTVQRSIANDMLFQVAYAGNKGTHLGAFECGTFGCGTPDMDQLPPQDMAMGSALLALVPNPFYGYIPGSGPLSQPTVAQGQLLRPFPAWTEVQPTNDGLGNSEYNALQVMFQKALASGTSFTASYTWSKTMTDVVSGRWIDGTPIRSWYCLRCEHGVSDYDVPQRFVLSGTWALPFGKGKKFGAAWPGWINGILGGWQSNGILSLASGMPLIFSNAVNNSFSFGGGQHPDATGVPASLGGAQNINEWFNPAAFAQPAPFTFGNLGRAFTAVRQDWTRNLDFSLFKEFQINDRYRVQFRAEAFNITNTPVFGAPNTSLGSTAFGVVSTQSNVPRQMQLVLKFFF